MNTIYLDERISIAPIELNNIESQKITLSQLLEQKLRDKYEGRCNSSGYILPGSINLLTKSMGSFEHARFTGNILCDCRASCKIYVPVAKSILNVKITKVNKAGAFSIIATEGIDQAIRILIPRDSHLGDVGFDALVEGSIVSIQLLRSTFQTNSPYISGIGQLQPQGKV
jgi:DNA-directed RNA polymerase subunit E'/Rpb7